MTPPPPRSTPFPTRRSSDLDRIKRDKDLVTELANGNFPEQQKGESHKTGSRPRHANPEKLPLDRKSTRLNSSHRCISYAVFCLKKKKKKKQRTQLNKRQIKI